MNNLNKSFLVLATIGILVAIYHGYDEVTHYSSPITNTCNINALVSCSTVFNSGYTKFLGVSMYIYGLVWFPLMLVLGYWFVRRSGTLRFEVMFPLLMVGNVFTIYLWYLELVKIHALCPVCISLYSLNYLMTAVCLIETFTEG
jgi:uncharacterized membrane protein